MKRDRGLVAGVSILAILAVSAGLDVGAVAFSKSYRDGWGYVDVSRFGPVFFRAGTATLLLVVYTISIFYTMARRRLPFLTIALHAIVFIPMGLLLCLPFAQILGIFSPVNFPMMYAIRTFGSYVPIAVIGLSLAGLSAALLGIAISNRISPRA